MRFRAAGSIEALGGAWHLVNLRQIASGATVRWIVVHTTLSFEEHIGPC